MPDRNRIESHRAQSAPGAALVIGALVLLLVVLVVLALRNLSGAGEGAREMVASWFASSDAPEAGETAVEPAIPREAAAIVAAEEAERGDPSLAGALEACLPALRSLAQDVRVLAVAASATNVDFVQESATLPGRFVRVGCGWDGHNPSIFEGARVLVPPGVGEVRDIPRDAMGADELAPQWFLDRFRGAARALDGMVEIQRIEASYVRDAGVLARLHVLHNGEPRTVVLFRNDTVAPEAQYFPQVERLSELTAEAAARGYRDVGRTTWSVGLLDTVEQLRDTYFPRGQRLLALDVQRHRIVAHAPAPRGTTRTQRWEIDEYGDRGERDADEDQPGLCARAFTLDEAADALVAAMRERGQSRELFEATEFESAAYFCADGARRPKWRFVGG